ncbi:dihydroxyacetone kinase subunit DhaL [Nocardioides pyridinolyticus]
MTNALSTEDLRRWLDHFGAAVLAQADELDELDSATGDGEHGSNLKRGVEALEPVLADSAYDDVRALLDAVGMAVVNSVGGASGALYGTVFLRLSDEGDGVDRLDLARLSRGFASAAAGIGELGRTQPGDKTLLDAIAPAVEALQRAEATGADLTTATEQAAAAAAAGRDATAAMTARVGRGSYLGDRSMGHVDAGATSMAQLFQSLHAVAAAGSPPAAAP